MFTRLEAARERRAGIFGQRQAQLHAGRKGVDHNSCMELRCRTTAPSDGAAKIRARLVGRFDKI